MTDNRQAHAETRRRGELHTATDYHQGTKKRLRGTAEPQPILTTKDTKDTKRATDREPIMTFPGTVPVTAQANEEGVCVPAGWGAVYRYEPEDVVLEVPEPYRRIVYVSLRVPWGLGWRDVVTDGGQLGSQDAGLVGDYYYQFVRLLELAWYARLGLIGSAAGYAARLEGGEPLVQSWTCSVVDGGGSGTSIGLSTAPTGGRSDPRALPFAENKTLTLTGVSAGQTITINGLTFTAHATTTTPASRQFKVDGDNAADAGQLVTCISHEDYGVPGISASAEANVITLRAGSSAVTVSNPPASIAVGTSHAWGPAASCIQPGDVLSFNGIEAMVCSLPDLSSLLGVATVALHKPIYAQAGDVVTVLRQQPTLWFGMPVYRAKWVEELRTDWLPWSGGPIELKRSSGGAGAIAWPYRDDDPEAGYKGHFRAWERKADGTIEDVTSEILLGFPGLGSEPRLSIYTDDSGETHTYVTPFSYEYKTLTLTGVSAGQTITINGLTFTAHATTTTPSSRQFKVDGDDAADAEQLVACLMDAQHGVPGITVEMQAGTNVIELRPAANAVTVSTPPASIAVETVSDLGVSSAYKFRYVMEAVSQNFPSGATQWRGSQSCCKWVCRDWSNMIARGGDAGTKLDTGGRHWFCEKRFALSGSFYLARFNEWCMQTECPSFAQRVPWRLGVAAMARVAMGRNLYLRGEGDNAPVARAQNPSLMEMAGMPGYTGDETSLTPVIWYAKTTPAYAEGLFGVLEDVPVSERQADEGLVKRLRYGAVKGNGAGLLAQGGAFVKADRAGGVSYQDRNQYDDGSDYYTEEAYQPLREWHVSAMDESGFGAVASGKCEAEVQRVRPQRVRVPGVVKGEDATINGVAVTWEKDGEELTGKLTLTIPPMWGKTFGAKSLSARAATIERAAVIDSGNVLLLEFLPEEVTCEGLNAQGDAVQYTWLSGGGTVCAKNEQRIFNPKAVTQNKFGSMAQKVCRGDSIRIPELTGYENTLLTVIWAKAHAGAIYAGAGASAAPNGASVPAIYQTASWRLAQDVVYLDLPSGGPGGALREFLNAGGSLALVGKTIEVTSRSVMPPLRSARFADGQATFTETDYTVQVRHFSQGAEPSEGTILAGLEFDPANGVIVIPSSETDGWDVAAKHHLAILSAATGGGCFLFQRGEGLCAEHLTYLRTALRRLQWFQPDDVVVATVSEAISAYVPASGINEGGAFWATICTNGASRPIRAGGQVCKTWPSAVTGNNMAPYGGIAGSIPSGGAYPIIEPSIPLSLFSEYNAAWDKLYFRSTGGAYQQGCPAGSGDVNGQWMFIRYFAWCNQVIELTPQYLGRFRAEWIGQALLEIKCSGAVVTRFTTTWTWNAETYGLESSVVEDTSARQVHLAAYVATEVTIPGLETPGYTFEKAGISVPFSLPTTNKWETVDVTALVRELCRKPYPAGQKLFLVVQAGAGIDVSGEYGARDLARSCFQSSVTIGDWSESNPYGYKESFLEWDGEKYVDGDGQVGNVVGGSQVFSHLSYEGFSARDLRIKLDWDGMEQEDYLPHRVLLADGGGNMPAMA